jgi:hypothetical protein
MTKTETYYEVQFVDGFGSWRRWSLCRTAEAAAKSMARLDLHGIKSGRVRLTTKGS